MKERIKWPAGNRLDLCIPLRKITVTEEGTQFGEYVPSQAAVVMVYLVGNYASYEYTPRIEDNKLFITDNGELKPGVYAIDVRIQEPERKLRSFRCGELEIVRETKQLALGDFVLDNNITLDADAFIFGEGPSAYEVAVRDGYTGTKTEWLESMRGKEGRGIADIVALPTGAFRILLTDGSAYVTPTLKGEQGVSIVDFTVSSITSQEVICTITMSDGTTRTVNLPRGEKGEQGDAGEDGRGIQSVVMNNDYTITFSYTDGTSYTTPQALRGEKGENGQDGQDGQDGRGISSMALDDDNHLTVSYSDGTTYTTPQSLQGERGVSITDFEQVGESATMCFFNIYFSNGNISQIGLPKGEQGDRGEQGPQGPKGDTVVLGEVGEYKLYNVGGTATDGAMTQDATTKAIAASNGYYECGTAAGTAAKVAVGDNEALYTLQKGGSIKVKMANANAAASGVTLKIGSSAATPLYYNGEAVSASNTWEAGEVISVYYDGTYYQATNAKVGSGKAADMKYDNSQSGLAAENVQGALDEVVNDLVNKIDGQSENDSTLDFALSDANGNIVFCIKDGHIITKNFKSSALTIGVADLDKENCAYAVTDSNGNMAFVITEDGHLVTKNFNSRNVSAESLAILEKLANLVTKFNGKTMAVIGDSISTYSGYTPSGWRVYYPTGNVNNVSATYWHQVATALGMTPLNCAYSASYVTGDSTQTEVSSSHETGECAGCSEVRIASLTRDGNTPDVVLILLGTNDYNAGKTLGSWTEHSAIPSEGTINQFSSAYALMLHKIKTALPNTRIFCCTILQRNFSFPEETISVKDYNDVIKKMASIFGCDVIDTYACGISRYNIGSYTVDGAVHPNAAGHKLVANKIITELISKY